jgi:hypothetical protein
MRILENTVIELIKSGKMWKVLGRREAGDDGICFAVSSQREVRS